MSPRLLAVVSTVLSVLLAGYWAARVAVQDNHHEDLWIYSQGAKLALDGHTPYDVAAIHAKVDERWPDDPNLKGNAGFFLTPAAVPVLAPFALPPWEGAKVAWCGLTIALAAAAAWLLRSLSDRPLPGWFTALAVAGTLLNPLSLFVLLVGQTTLFVLGCVVLGEVLDRNGWKRAGAAVWALAFLKPHIAFPLLPLAWWLGGWRRLAEVGVWVAALNFFAGVFCFGKPFVILDYLKYVQGGHQTVEFNRVGVNRQITSWNRLLTAAGGPTFELGMLGTLAGYAVLGGLAAVRVWVGKVRPTREWCFALAGCGAVACCQLLPYELPLMLLGLPCLVGLLASPRITHRLAAGVIAAFAGFAFVDGGDGDWYYQLIARLVDPANKELTAVLQSHRALGTLGTLLGVLAAGPVGLTAAGPAAAAIPSPPRR